MEFADGNPGPDFGQERKYGRVKPVYRSTIIIGSPITIQK
jgi:hypothetical protein